MQKTPEELARNLYEIAGPVFASLKEEAKAAHYKTKSHPHVKELSFTQLRILLAIEHGNNQVGKLAKSARVAQPAMSKIVDLLIQLDLIKRSPHPRDRRQINLFLTAKGTAMMDRLRAKAAEKYVPAIEALNKSEFKKISEGIALILKVIEKAKGEIL